MVRAAIPLNEKAREAANKAFYAKYKDEFVDENGKRIPLNPCDPKQRGLHMEWLKLYSEDFIPRAIICDWNVATESMGILNKESVNGTKYSIDGPGFVLYQCIQSVGEDPGMFVIYTKDVEAAVKDTSYWPLAMRERLHIIDKRKMSCKELLDFILKHGDYANQHLIN